MRGHLEQRDLYARLALKTNLSAQQQADMLAWAEAHTVLTFIAKDGLLERFAAQSPVSWAALCRLGEAARTAGCSDESPYALLADGEMLRALVTETAPVATKLMKLLPWCSNPLNNALANPLHFVPTTGGTRNRTKQQEEDDYDGGRIQRVRVKQGGTVWEHVLDWDQIANVREPSPGRDRGSLHQGTAPRFGRQSLREY